MNVIIKYKNIVSTIVMIIITKCCKTANLPAVVLAYLDKILCIVVHNKILIYINMPLLLNTNTKRKQVTFNVFTTSPLCRGGLF